VLIVFSDLDGSLLDHDTYDWRPARPALEALGERDIPLVLVSSKTLAELEEYRGQLDLPHPVVAENGAVLAKDEGKTTKQTTSHSTSFVLNTVSR